MEKNAHDLIHRGRRFKEGGENLPARPVESKDPHETTLRCHQSKKRSKRKKEKKATRDLVETYRLKRSNHRALPCIGRGEENNQRWIS